MFLVLYQSYRTELTPIFRCFPSGKLNKDVQLQQMDECYGRIQALIGEGFGQDNKSSLGQLFFSFFGQVKVKKLLDRQDMSRQVTIWSAESQSITLQ